VYAVVIVKHVGANTYISIGRAQLPTSRVYGDVYVLNASARLGLPTLLACRWCIQMSQYTSTHATHTHTSTKCLVPNIPACQASVFIRVFGVSLPVFTLFFGNNVFFIFVPVCQLTCVSAAVWSVFPVRVDCYMSPTIYTLVFQ
jgi:hypothetical protein